MNVIKKLLPILSGLLLGVLMTIGLMVGWIVLAGGGPNPLEGHTAGLRFENRPARAPLATLEITWFHSQPSEVRSRLLPGVSLANVVNMELFKGFRPTMSADEARASFGPANGAWLDPYYRVVARYYERSEGRVSLAPVPGSPGPDFRSGVAWTVVGYPNARDHASVIRDETLLAQIRPYLPAHGWVPVDILGDSIRCTIVMSRDNSAPMIITEAPPK